jgi:nicotinamide mononucleotide transporter
MIMEILAIVLALLYLILAIRQNILCWLCAAISTLIYIFLFFEAKLYMESFLNVFYFLMAIFGWYSWSGKKGNLTGLNISVWSFKIHFFMSLLIILISIASGYYLSINTDASYPYLDSMTTYFSIWATYLIAQKVLENWWYWLVIDLCSVVIYWLRDLEATALLFLVYILLIPFGMMAWKRSYNKQII